MAKLSTILDQIDAGSMLLPEFQRGYVWNRDQVRELMRSLFHGFPVGALLVGETVNSKASSCPRAILPGEDLHIAERCPSTAAGCGGRRAADGSGRNGETA